MININFIYLGAAISILGSSFYIRDTLRGTTQPNRVTWLLWAVAPLLAFAVEVNSGVGLRSLMTFMVGFLPLVIFLCSFVNPKSVWKITRFDYICGALSVLGTIGWLLTRNGTFGIVAAILADGLAAVPTLRKSWSYPESETVGAFLGAAINALITLLTITTVTTAEIAFPLYIFIIASAEVVLILAKPGPRLAARETSTIR